MSIDAQPSRRHGATSARRQAPIAPARPPLLHNKIIHNATTERAILVTLFVFIFLSYGAIGRDVFYNHLYMTKENLVDPIGSILPHLRLLFCGLAILTVAWGAGINWALSKIPWLYAPFALMALMSFIWAGDTKEAARNAVVMTALWLALAMLMFRIGLLLTVKVCLYIIAWICILSVFVAIVFPKVGIHDGLELQQFNHTGRWRGIFAHKNMLGPWAAYGTVLLFCYSWLCGGSKAFWWIARICAMICLVMAQSATGIMAAVTLAGCYGIFMLVRAFGLISALIFLLCFAGLGGISFYMLGDAFFDLLGRDSTLTGRTAIWDLALDYFWEHPWIGNGYQTMGGSGFTERTFVMFGATLGPESGYLSLLLDMGVIGAVLFAIPNLVAIRNGFEWMPFVNEKDRACIEFLLAVLVAALVQSFVESNVLIATGFDGIISFCSFFGLMTLPRSPVSAFRSEFRMAKHQINPAARG